MTETCLRSITNSGTWMLILAPTYSTKIFIGQTTQQHTLFPLSSVCYLPEIRSSVSQYLVQSHYREGPEIPLRQSECQILISIYANSTNTIGDTCRSSL